MNPIYKQLEDAVLPIMTHFKEDLTTHNKAKITDDTPFLHWATDSHTHISFLLPADSPHYPSPGKYVPYLLGTADREKLLSESLSFAKYNSDPRNICSHTHLVHYFDGRTLRKIDSKKALDIASEHVRSVENAWSKPRSYAVA